MKGKVCVRVCVCERERESFRKKRNRRGEMEMSITREPDMEDNFIREKLNRTYKLSDLILKLNHFQQNYFLLNVRKNEN